MSKLNNQSLRAPFVDPNTGVIVRPWVTFIEQLISRTGGSDAKTNTELELAATQAQATADAAQLTANAAQSDATQALNDISLLASHTPVYMQDTEPPATSIWFKTDPVSGLVIDIMQVTP